MLLDSGIPTTLQLVSGTLHAKGYMPDAIKPSLRFLETFLNRAGNGLIYSSIS
ncbi:hypothetical protein OQZ33_15865 [Pedobacter sp. MC2016-05]|uniref:hypothetical protein n=1 Tax=Pedobacter sp. MC2016-05 TaxID=2994474 RepID=UPI00224810EA|nr:hypothetical protein [Pedobacter sp. MC2016-05]MCX2475810.1 hypothetical protein [Pedobacter sp. MC2016-05]